VASDLYALGVVLCELLTGRLTFVAQDGGPIARLAQTHPLAAVALECLRRSPDQRPRGAAEVLARLDACDGLRARAKDRAHAGTQQRPPRRIRRTAALAAGAVAAAASLALYVGSAGQTLPLADSPTRTRADVVSSPAHDPPAAAPLEQPLTSPAARIPPTRRPRRAARAQSRNERHAGAPAPAPRLDVMPAADEPIRALAPPMVLTPSDDDDAPISSLRE
jgi:hypothetical protein